jgi:tryptophan synthase alpha chain
VSNGAQAAEVAAFADGVIVGSAYVRVLLDGGGADGVRALTEDLARGVRA